MERQEKRIIAYTTALPSLDQYGTRMLGKAGFIDEWQLRKVSIDARRYREQEELYARGGWGLLSEDEYAELITKIWFHPER
jgi:hypothetical protein